MKKIYRNLFIIMIIVLFALSCSKADTTQSTAAAPAKTVSEPVTSEPKAAVEAPAATADSTPLTESPAEEKMAIVLGEKMPDFSFVDFNGNEHNLYSILEEKDCVLINLFTSWCGPCRKEFPYLQASYNQYKDRIEVIGLSVEEEDSFEVLAEYAANVGLTFPIGRDELQFYEILLEPGFPTSIVIDKFGYITLIETGSVPSQAYFDSLFEFFLSDDYTETEVLYEFPEIVSTEPLLDVEDLSAALDVNSDRIRLENPKVNSIWPMTITEYNGETVLGPTNSLPGSYTEVKAIIDGEVNEGFSISCAMPNNSLSSHGQITVDGEVVKYFINSDDFVTFTYQFKRSGEHEVSISSVINSIALLNGDTNIEVYYNSLKYLTEEETIEGLKNNVVYPTGEGELSFTISEESNAEELYIIGDVENDESHYLVDGDTVSLTIELGENTNPENLYFYTVSYEALQAKIVRLVDLYKDGKFSITLDMPSKSGLGIMRALVIDTNTFIQEGYNIYSCEDAVNTQMELYIFNTLSNVDWAFKNPDIVRTTTTKTMEEVLDFDALDITTDATYSVQYIDQNGDPIPGVMLQVCDETLCQVFISDAGGFCTFTLPPYEYELHTLMVPSGYDADSTVYTAQDSGEDIVIVINKH